MTVPKESSLTNKNDKTEITATEKTVFKALALGGLDRGGGPCAVDVKDGKIVRIRPMHYDWKYTREQISPWKFERDGKVLEPLLKEVPAPFSLAYKKRVYSPNRIKYPMRRVDWEPNGERNTQNRGKSKYRRISWDEASEIIASEIKRIHKKYGPTAILAQADGHGECKTVHAPHGQQTWLLEKMGGFTQQVRNPDSWEGWYWGSKHVWGQGSVGMMDPSANVLKDMTENCEQILFWGCDPETTMWGFTSQFASRLCLFWTEIGIKQIYICPDLNYGAAVHADKWIPILPNTDAALQLAIAYVWISEDTYDKEYISTHAVGFDKFRNYVLGNEDGVPKTPAWASENCRVPEWTIKALAREFASRTTSIAHHYGGSMIRGPFAHEPARLECILLGMQGLGQPGVHQSQMTTKGMPRSSGLETRIILNPMFSKRLQRPIQATVMRLPVKQLLPKTLVHTGIMTPPLNFWGNGAIYAQTEDQFEKYTYPLPKEEGGSEIHMLWTDTPCRTTCWNCGNETIEAMRDPKIEFVLAQHPWLENDCLFADIILPANTTMEVEDIVTNNRCGLQFYSIALQEQAIPPIGESKSDFEVVGEVAKKLGKYGDFTEGQTVEALQKSVFDSSGVEDVMTWEEFKEKGYYVLPPAKDWEKDPAGLFEFHRNPEANPLPTPSGKLEFYSERLAEHFPDDQERPPLPHWIEKSETHDERISSERAKKYPLLLMSNHGRWRVHAQCDDVSWTREILSCKVKGQDGYMYEPVWMNPIDAVNRGINNGDIVQIVNERGVVLGGALVWERIMPGVVSIDHGARVDPIDPGKIDRGGAVDLISPTGLTSKHCVGMATSGFLVNVEKVTMAQMEEWEKLFPESFMKEYDPASGLRFDAWIER
jgi:trimethylamine-N-oxide reductase (cytochrome c)